MSRRTHVLAIPFLSVAVLVVLSCQPPPKPEVQYPRDLTYPQDLILGHVGLTLEPTSPTYTGEVETFSVTPDLPSGIFIDEATGAISGTPESAHEAAMYVIKASNVHGSDSFAIDIRVVSPPSITQEPKAVYASKGGRAIFSVAADGLAPLSYQWYYGSILLPDRNHETLLLENITESDTGDYLCVVSDSVGVKDTSESAHLYVSADAQAPAIQIQPRGGTFTAGEQAVLSVAAQGTDLEFQWLKSGVVLDEEIGSELVIDSVSVSDTGCYVAVISNSLGADTSNQACISLVQSSYNLSLTAGANGTVLAGAQTITGQQSIPISRDSSITLFFQPDTGYRVAQLTVDGTPNPQALSTGSYSIAQVQRNHSIEVTFEKRKYAFRALVNDTSFGRVLTYPDEDSISWKDSVVVIAVPSENCYFAGWSGTVPQGKTEADTLVFFADSAVHLEANFARIGFYPLLITVSPDQGGSVTKDPDSVAYAEGTQVSVTARPSEGYRFVGWQGDASGAELSASITMDSTQAITAEFEKITWAVSLSSTPEAGGVVGPVADTSLGLGDIMNLVATPDVSKGYSFVAWRKSGGTGTVTFGDSTSATTTLEISGGDVSVTAIFQAVGTFSVGTIVEPAGAGRVEISPSKDLYAWGEIVTVRATPELGYKFSTWSGDTNSSESQLTLTVDGDISLTAQFSVSETVSEQVAAPGTSLNAMIKQVSAAPGPGTIIVPDEGKYDEGTIEIGGKVTIPIQRK